MKERILNIWNSYKNLESKSFFWLISILYLEIIFVLFISKTLNIQLFINILLSSIIISKVLCLITGFFNELVEKILSPIILAILGILFSLQGVFYKIFKVYFSLYNLALKDQVKSFAKDAISLIFKNSIYILLFMLPFILYIVLLIIKTIKITKVTNKLKNIMYLLLSILLWIGILHIYVNVTKNDRYSTYEIYNNVNNISLSVKKLGVLQSYKLETKRLIFGFSPKKLESIKMSKEVKKEEEEIEYGENILTLNLSDTGNTNVDLINNYIKNEEPTSKNKYTGMFKDHNLIYITAESFSEIGVDPTLTPTLYKLTHSGFVFKNFYTPNNLSTIGGEFQSLTGLYPDFSILSKWRDGTNYFPFGLGTQFQLRGYSTNAYHNNSYVFQDRHKYLATQGFYNFLACYNGLEQRMNCGRWPQSDDEMMEVTVGDYIYNTTPFMAYYMTVSGHLGYTYNDNSIAYKNMELVRYLDKNENAQAYIATQIELDRALERLINYLTVTNKLDNTVIVLLADHYPYGLDNATINSLSNYYRDDIEINHNALIIWNSKMETIEVEKPCMSADVLPTVYNLFGIDYDSRLFTGKDILSDSFGIAVMGDRSWVTSKGTYYAPSNVFVPKEEVTEDYVNIVNNLVNSRLTISRMILENNYYNYVFR
ncbi:MAG: LTA synthase family protein [Bacilli bacterium]|nr:LTA synthase family protein [Bacilli bacterium]